MSLFLLHLSLDTCNGGRRTLTSKRQPLASTDGHFNAKPTFTVRFQ